MFPPPPNPKKNWAVELLTTGFIVQPAALTSRLPGARFAGLSAPGVLFVGRPKHFVRPLG